MNRISRRQALQAAAAGLTASVVLAHMAIPSWAKAGLTGTVYTANEHGNSLSAIDLTSSRVDTVPLPISPHNVQISRDGKRLLVVGIGGEDEHGHSDEAEKEDEDETGLLLVIDPARLSTDSMASIPIGRHPAHVVPDQSDRLALVSLSEEDAVVAIDLASHRIAGRIGTGTYPHGLRLHPGGEELWVANVKDGSLSVLDLRGGREAARIPIGAAPVQVGFLPSGRRLFASLRDENSVAVIDVAGRHLVGKIPVQRGPIQVFASPDGSSVYVANQGSEADPDRCLCIIDAARLQVTAQVPVGLGAHGVAVSSDGRAVFVTNIVDGTVSIVDARSRAVLSTFKVGAGPNGITYRASAFDES